MADYMGGLLGSSPFRPSLPPGLLQMLAQPGQPAAQMAQNMMQVQAGQQAPPRAPAAPAPAPAPAPAATPPPPAPTISPTQTGLIGGGIAAMRAAQGGNQGSLGASLGEGLAAGVTNFVASKDREADRKAAVQRQETYARNIQNLVKAGELDAATATGLMQMGVEAGAKVLAEAGLDIMKEKAKPYTLSRGQQRRDGDNKVVAENVEPEKPFDANLSSDMADALFLVLGRDPADRKTFLAAPTEEEAKKINQHLEAMANLKRSLTTVHNNMGAGEKAGIVKAFELASTSLNNEFEQVRMLPERIRLYDGILELAEKGDYKSGSLADVRQAASKLARIAGLPVDTESLTDTDVILSRLRDAALLELKRLDARPTDKDMEVLLQKIGQLGTDPAALIQIARDNQAQARRALQDYNRRREATNAQFSEFGGLPAYIEEIEPPATRDQQRAADMFGVPIVRRGSQ